MYRISFSKRILGLPFTIASVVVQSARNPDRALRAAKIKFARLFEGAGLAGAGGCGGDRAAWLSARLIRLTLQAAVLFHHLIGLLPVLVR